MTLLKPTLSKMIYALAAITAIAISFGIYTSQQNVGQSQTAAPRQAQAAQAGALASLKPHVDLGTISMAAGLVPYQYLIKNTAATPLNIKRIFTSCMCTTATLVTAKERQGPFGMPGHGRAKTVNALLAPGELASVEVVFDPAAHGPSGLGRVDRFVTVESAEAAPLELHMAVMVRP